MIKGIGIDIVELDRIESLMIRKSKFIERILSEREREKFNQYTNKRRKIEFLSGRFAAKEDCSKAFGTGIGQAFSFQSIEILSDENGRPSVYIHGEKKENIFVSISHSKEYAVAQIIIV